MVVRWLKNFHEHQCHLKWTWSDYKGSIRPCLGVRNYFIIRSLSQKLRHCQTIQIMFDPLYRSRWLHSNAFVSKIQKVRLGGCSYPASVGIERSTVEVCFERSLRPYFKANLSWTRKEVQLEWHKKLVSVFVSIFFALKAELEIFISFFILFICT